VAAPPSLPVDLDAYATDSMATRVATAVDTPEVDELLPTWHLSTYVEPGVEHARALPHLLGRLNLCHPPSATELDCQALLKPTLDYHYRGHDRPRPSGARPRYRAGGEVATADRLDPDLSDARVHA
jgi:hypothetical protein